MKLKFVISGIINEIKDLASKDSVGVKDLAVIVILTFAFGRIIFSFSEDILLPLIVKIIYVNNNSVISSQIHYGAFLRTIFDFLVVAFVLMVIIKLLTNRTKKFSTHLPVFEEICKTINCNNIFEYGMGMFSTKFFENHFKSVLSVEMQEEEWYEKMKSENLKDNVKLECIIGETEAISYFKSLNTNFSCVFVDGHVESRWKCINEAFGKTDVIIAHDTEKLMYKWHLVKKPDNYVWIDIKDFMPNTSVITCDKTLIQHLFLTFTTSVRK